jgi:hypothetical protein
VQVKTSDTSQESSSVSWQVSKIVSRQEVSTCPVLVRQPFPTSPKPKVRKQVPVKASDNSPESSSVSCQVSQPVSLQEVSTFPVLDRQPYPISTPPQGGKQKQAKVSESSPELSNVSQQASRQVSPPSPHLVKQQTNTATRKRTMSTTTPGCKRPKPRTSTKLLGSCNKKHKTWTELSRNQAGHLEMSTRRNNPSKNKPNPNSEAEKIPPPPVLRKSQLIEENQEDLLDVPKYKKEKT